MKLTYSNSYDRSAGYAANITADANTITISMFYEESAATLPGYTIVDGITVHQSWAGKQLIGYSTITLSLDEVKAQPAWADRSVWTGSGRFLPDALLPPAKHTKLWHNITAETVNNKVRPTDHFTRQLRTSPMDLGAFLLYVPFKDVDFTGCDLHVLSKIDGVPHLFNGSPITDPETNPMDAQASAMPRMQISGVGTIKSGDIGYLNLQLTDASGNPITHDCEAYIETVGGFLPMPRAQITGGVGTVKILALGLAPGDTMRVKAGFKFWSSDSEHIVQVV